MDLTTLREKKDKYAQEQAEKIVQKMIDREEISSTLATCDYPRWDRDLHRAMPSIVQKLREMGVSTTSSVNHGVTDWVFTIN